ncbi:hypothetical protein HG537_0D04310 [Torulaspora globosa]|uniref:Protein kinase domain-containing protein n=1 Tax=Torulaspora globosa TaxID=48254 RepID=A0A7H9HSY9_9SACH|nr:hypothetical protein HG537_0D04310 [Torulaspora sp. CBS 2947]
MGATNGGSRTSSSVGTHTVERFQPGAIVSVGSHKVEIVNYLTDGGFAQIYVVKFLEYLNEFDKTPLKVGEIACLKRVLVQDENGLSEMRNEVEVMKQLMGAKNVVQYYDSNACRRRNGNGGFEVLLLMELCPNKSLLDYMNQRLATKLTEPEILKIMVDVSLAVAQMHYLKVPLIHRDIKIENVLVDAENNFKLCDFGSTSQCFPVVTTHQEIAILTQNIYVHTTPQYRCPEMIDLYRCLPINEKSDIWALGIFLYKLLFFTTPFEMTGQFAILHSKYEFPPNNYSSQLINLIIIMLAENPYMRPNIYQVLNHVCSIIGVEVPIEDKYGAGPYDFQKYTEFQTRLQDTQYQMYVLQQKRLENGRLNQLEENLLNNLMITAFEVSAKVPMEAESRDSSNAPEIHPESVKEDVTASTEDVAERKSTSTSLPEEVPEKGSSVKKAEKVKVNQIAEDNAVDSSSDIPKNQNIAEKMTEKTDTDVGTQNIFATQYTQHLGAPTLDQRQKSLSSASSGGKSYMSGSQALSSDEIVEPITKSDIAPTPNIKQHKSNNPFPRMARGYTDHTKAENFFVNDMSAGSQQQQQPFQQPPSNVPPEALYVAQGEGIAQQQRPQYIAEASQQIRQQHVSQAQSSYIYRSAEIPHGALQQKQQQAYPFRQAQDAGGLANPNMGYNYQNTPANTNMPYYTVQQGQKGSFNLPHHELQPRPMGPPQSQQRQARYDQGIPSQIPNTAQNENPPPMPARREKPPTETSEAAEPSGKEGELLIAFSPPKQTTREDAIVNRENATSLQKQRSRHTSLDLSYNEMDLSQDDVKADSPAFHTGGMDSSIASSESIELNLDEAKIGARSLRISRDGVPSRSFEPPTVRRRDCHIEELTVHQKEPQHDIPARRSLDLQYHEIHFSSPDLNSENHHNSTETTKHKTNRVSSKKTTPALSDGATRGHHGSTHSSGATSRKHSTNIGNGPKTASQIRNDLERYKAKNSSDSNSSVNLSSTSLSGMRRSFAKARQSLDLERVRREALNNSESAVNANTGKRRSLFSVFRGSTDKK